MAGRVAWVTGGVAGLGRALSLGLAAAGARVFAADIQPPAVDQTLSQAGIEVLRCDVRDEQSVQAALEELLARAGRLDILVNNAGVTLVKPIPDVTESEWDLCLDTNLKGAFLCSRAAIRQFRQQRGAGSEGGVIVNISSNAGLLPRVGDPVYCVSKAALIALTKSLALCHAPERIRVNAVCPGPVERTGMIDRELATAADPQAVSQQIIAASPLARALGRMVRPEEIAQAVVYLCSDAAELVTGTALAIDGGKALGVPPRIDE